jgi:hypothetical protein
MANNSGSDIPLHQTPKSALLHYSLCFETISQTPATAVQKYYAQNNQRDRKFNTPEGTRPADARQSHGVQG